MPYSMSSSRLAALACVVALSVAANSCSKPATPEAATAARAVMSVELVSAKPSQWNSLLIASGEIAPWQETVIGSEVGGARLDEVLVDVGDHVRKGQRIARFNSALLKAEWAQQQATVKQAEANLAKAKADDERGNVLVKNGSISQQAVSHLHTAVLTSEAALEVASAQLQMQTLHLSHAGVRAPDDGIISSRKATAGSLYAVGAELFRLIRQGRLEWRAEVSGDVLSQLDSSASVSLKRPDGQVVKGKIRRVAPTVDATSRNGLVYVDLPSDSGLAAGMYVAGEFKLGTSSALNLPESAFVLRDGNRYVMKVDENRRVHQVKVVTGRRQGDSTEVIEGLSESDRVIKTGGSFVADGDLVGVPSAADTPAVAAAANKP